MDRTKLLVIKGGVATGLVDPKYKGKGILAAEP